MAAEADRMFRMPQRWTPPPPCGARCCPTRRPGGRRLPHELSSQLQPLLIGPRGAFRRTSGRKRPALNEEGSIARGTQVS